MAKPKKKRPLWELPPLQTIFRLTFKDGVLKDLPPEARAKCESWKRKAEAVLNRDPTIRKKLDDSVRNFLFSGEGGRDGEA